jgi:hypothetical protein
VQEVEGDENELLWLAQDGRAQIAEVWLAVSARQIDLTIYDRASNREIFDRLDQRRISLKAACNGGLRTTLQTRVQPSSGLARMSNCH